MYKAVRFFIALLTGFFLVVAVWMSIQEVEVYGQSCFTNIVVANTNDSGPGALRQALVDICDGGIIDFAPSLIDQTIVLTSSQLNITKTLTISNSNAFNLKVSGDNSHAVFSIQSMAIVTISNLSIISGTVAASGGAYCPNYCGGGVLV